MAQPATRILIVEDQPEVAQDIRLRLERLGYVVAGSTDNGADAMALIERAQPDLVLMDIVLPGATDGIQAAAEIRLRFRIPVVYLTAFADEDKLRRARVTEPFGYILKPYSERELHAAISMALYKARTDRELEENVWFTATLTGISDPVISCDREGRVTLLNAAAETLLGRAAAECLGLNLDALLDLREVRSEEPVRGILDAVLQGRSLRRADYQCVLRTHGGAEIPVNFAASPVTDPHGKNLGGAVCLQDVSEFCAVERALRESERKFRTLALTTECAILVYREQFIYVNPAAERISGYSAEELCRRGVIDLVPPAYREFVRRRLGERMHGEAETRRYELPIQTKDGRECWVDLTASLIEFEGAPAAVASAVDITERKLAQDALRQQSLRLQSILDSIADGVVVTDERGHFLLFNPAAQRIVGMGAVDVPPEQWPKTYGFFQADSVKELYKPEELPFVRAMRGETVHEQEMLVRNSQRPDGVYVSVSARPLLDGDGNARGGVIAMRDITERLLAREIERRFKAILNATPDFVGMTDKDGNALYVNPAGREMVDMAPDFDETRTRIADYHPPEATKKILEEGLPAAIEHGCWTGETLFRGRNGRTVLTSQIILAHKSDSGEVEYFSTVARDITERKRFEQALAESERVLSTLMGNLPGLAYRCTHDTDRNLEFVSQGCLALTGYTVSELVGPQAVSFKDLIHPEDLERVKRTIDTALAERQPFQMIYRMRTKSGAEKTVWEQGTGVFNEDGSLRTLEGFISNITERVRAEEALEERLAFEQLISALSSRFVNIAPDQVDAELDNGLRALGEFLEVDRAYVFLVNEAQTHMSNTHEWCAQGISAEKDRLQDMPVKVLPWFWKRTRNFEVVAVESVATLGPEAAAEREEWEREAIQALITIPMEAGGKLIGFYGFDSVRSERAWRADWIPILRLVGEIFAAAFERRRAARKLTQYTERLKILNAIGRDILAARRPTDIAITALEAVRHLVPCDRASITRFDLDADEGFVLGVYVSGRTAIGAGHRFSLKTFGDMRLLERGRIVEKPDLANMDRLPVEELLYQEGIRSVIHVPLVARGQLIGALNLGSRQVDAFRPDHIAAVREVAPQLAVAMQQAQLREQIEHHAEQLELRVAERTQALKEVNAELEAFAYSISHDLRAPLRAMEGFAQALKEDYANRLDVQGHEYASRIVAAARRMDGLIRDLLDYSRISRTELSLVPIGLQSVVDELISHVSKSEAACIEVEKPLPVVRGHDGTLRHVVGNLISNALKFAAEGAAPRVRIRAEARDGGRVRFWVEDAGIGIPEEYQESIFKVFERLHGRERYPGTGIGLAIVRRGVERMGGAVGVESEPGTGSRFWVELEGND